MTKHIYRLVGITIDETLTSSVSSESEQDRKLAIHDLLEGNNFKLLNGKDGPYLLHLSSRDGRLVFDLYSQTNEALYSIGLSLSPFRRIVKDYFQICDSYINAVKSSNPQQIEAIDMARRGIHNEGSELLQERLNGKVEMDFETARRLFTLVCNLLWRST